MNSRARVPGLDGVRGLAILAVVVYHAMQGHFADGGFFGVDLFFVLSGYLITSLLLAEHARTGTISLRAFYRRRARRLLPALTLLLGAGLVVALVALSEGHVGVAFVAKMAAASVYTTNFFAAFHQLGVASHWIGGLWSLASEEQFYLGWPLLLIFLLRSGLDMATRVLRMLLGASVAGFYVIGATSSLQQLHYDPAARSCAILVGCLLATKKQPFVPRRSSLLVGALLFGGACLLCPQGKTPMMIFMPAALIGAALLVEHADANGSMFRWQPLMWLGGVSYSLYLWHPVLLWALPTQRLVAVTLALGIATLSTKLLENPVRKHGLAAFWWRSPTETVGAVSS